MTNKTDDVIKIDWNKTKYLHNGRSKGMFVFEGVEPTDIKAHAVADDNIGGRGDFSKVIAPLKLLAWTPVRTKTDDKGISAGKLPNGKNGIRLVVKHKGKEIIEEVSVVIEESIIQ